MNKTLRFFSGMAKKTLEKPETKTCEACGARFSCGAGQDKCWCFNVDLNRRVLADLRENFKDCLCENCLKKEKRPPTNTD